MTGTINVDESTDTTESQKEDVTDAMDISEIILKKESKINSEKEAITPKSEVRETFASYCKGIACFKMQLRD